MSNNNHYDTIYENCKRYFDGNELAASVIVTKYLLKDKDGNFLETDPSQLIQRIANELHRIEQNYPNSIALEEIVKALDHFKYIVPQGSPLFGIGNHLHVTSIANCFVIDSPIDSYGGIFKQDQELAQIMKRRGGVGIDLSTLRPHGSSVNNAARTSDGVACFMERFSNTTKEVAQNGRRGALLISISCLHPDVLDFIEIKRNLDKVNSANVSVKWTDEFLKAVEEDKEITLRFPVDIDPKNATTTKVVRAKDVWTKFVEAAHTSAEPGCLFWDTAKTQSITDCYSNDGFGSISTNPCAELFLSAYSECLLMSLNFSSFVKNEFQDNASFDYDSFNKYVRMIVRLIDDAVDLEMEKIELIIKKIKTDPEPEEIKNVELNLWKKILDICKKGRRVGIGTTGLADMLAKLNIKYASDKALAKVEKVFKKFHETIYDESCNLAKERGKFEVWDWEKEKDSHYIKILPKELQAKIKEHGRRNISNTTCPPTGSVSNLTMTSSGIEPVFMLSYKRNKKLTEDEITQGISPSYVDYSGIKWISFEVEHPGLQQWKQVHPKKSIEHSPYHGCTANDLNWKNRIKMQGLIQKYIDNSISVTVNLPKETSVEDVSKMYLFAWKEKCKGLTIYREGSRKGVLEKKEDVLNKRPNVLPCNIHYSTIDGKEWIFFVGLVNDQPYEIFGGKREKVEIPKKYKSGWLVKEGKNDKGQNTYNLHVGSLEKSDDRLVVNDVNNIFSTHLGSYTRIISMMLRHRLPIQVICEQLKKDTYVTIGTFESAISRVLMKYIKHGTSSDEVCPNCKMAKLIYQEGCMHCPQCLTSRCG